MMPRREEAPGPPAGFTPASEPGAYDNAEPAVRLMLVRLAGQPSRWSDESHRRTARAKTVEDLIAA
ncbi:hypothetical protein [Streptomyces sp. NPDC054838]